MDDEPAVDPAAPETPPDAPSEPEAPTPAPTPVEEEAVPPVSGAAPLEEAAAVSDPDSDVLVKYRGQFPATDRVVGRRWLCGEEQAVPWNVAVQLCASRFFASEAIPESLIHTR